ncbi:MAG: ribosome silencing factor [Candidatus Dadabacteria bacterium]|nr:ribosome silencing factor [Candidatus Dadabacteria bacterium]NIS08893.1 ribosome silencing factor [Candidatus Dadabacteria bacterium]NIV42592.1 ribosome silencing factor [Candidatus Dadabacteria bacterium]NIY22236.1 ribosome silencing factor [Candidatus Dadabacteria bacterium]
MPKNGSITPKKKALALAEAAFDKKAENIVILKMTKLSDFADYFVICSADSDRGVKTIVENVDKKCKELGEKPKGVEGLKECRWVLIDSVDVLVHVFYEPVREEFDIESLWNEAPRIKLPFIQEQIAN